MGGCNCKNGQSMDSMLENENKKPKSVGQSIIKYTLKVLGFLMIKVVQSIGYSHFSFWMYFKMRYSLRQMNFFKNLIFFLFTRLTTKYINSLIAFIITNGLTLPDNCLLSWTDLTFRIGS